MRTLYRIAVMSEDTNTPDEEQPAATVDTVEEAPITPEKPAVTKAAKPVAVVTPGASTDSVYLSRCVFKNMYARKSLTIHHLQRRLYELGFKDAYSDKDGWYGDLTAKSVLEFQEVNGLEPTGTMDAETFEAIFAGDANVTVVID